MRDRQLSLSELRMSVAQEDHGLRTILFGGGLTTSDGLVKGEQNRLGVAAVLNRMVTERLDLVGEISVLRARVGVLERERDEARAAVMTPWRGPEVARLYIQELAEQASAAEARLAETARQRDEAKKRELAWEQHTMEQVRKADEAVASASRAEEALRWFDFIEDVEADGPPDAARTVSITRTNAGWRRAREAYDAALKAAVYDSAEARQGRSRPEEGEA